MTDVQTTYAELFELLQSLGFVQTSGQDAASGSPIFLHSPTETILAFRRKATALVTPADMLSTEVHLSGRRIIDQPIETRVAAKSVK